MKTAKVTTTEKGVKIGSGIMCGFVSWEDLGDVITVLQNLDQDHNSSENLEHEYESL